MKKLPYTEGSVFLVPLETGGYARGVVARSTKKGKVIFGYFFGPRLASSDNVTWDDLDPASAILRIRFGDLGLINHTWPILGKIANWNRENWPMPDFVIRNDDMPVRLKPQLVRYADDDPTRMEGVWIVDEDAVVGLTEQSMYGYGAVEGELTDLLEQKAP